MRRGLKIAGGWLAVGLCLAIGLSWDAISCGPAPPPEGEEGAYELAEMVPRQADGVFFAPRLEGLVKEVGVLQEAWTEGATEVGRSDSWAAVGAWMEGSAAAVVDDGEWMIMGWVDPEGESSLERWPGTGEEVEEAFADEVRRLDTSGWGAGWVASDGRRLAVGTDLEKAQQWWALNEEEWMVPERDHRPDAWPASLDRWRVHGQIGVSGLLADRLPEPESERMDMVGQALLRGLETVHLARPMGGDVPDDGRRVIELWTPGADAQIEMAMELGEARGELPDLGGLVQSGVPGVIRVSGDAEALFMGWRRTLGAAEQEAFSGVLEQLDEELEIDVMADVVANLSGQWAVVFLGLEQGFFELQGRERIASMIRLEAPRVAAVIPFEDRDRLRQLLDATTQLSKGKLRRQAMDRTIQYAWLDDGALQWIVILDEDYLVVVDSMGAFDQVRRWEQSPQPLEGVFAERGVDALLERRQGLGAYLDLATIRGMVREGGDVELASWLKPVDALRIESDIDGQRQRSQIVVWPRGTDEETP